jgi:hypothetical protein
VCGFLPALCPGQRAANRIPARPEARSSIAQLLIPVGSAARGGEVVQVPERLDGAGVAGILPGLGWCVEKLRGPEVADRLPVAVEHVQHRPLIAFRGLGEVVAVIGGAGRGQQAQSAPAALVAEGENALQWRLPDDREVDALGDVL